MLRMSDIAAKAGVSQSTVSFVLNGRHTAIRISEETRQKVLDAAEELGYRNNRIARAVRTGNTRMLGIVGGMLVNEHVGDMIAGAITEANIANYTIKPLPKLDENQNSRDIVRWGSEWRLSGVISLHISHELIEAMHTESQSYGYPLVLLDTRTNIEGVPQIVSDDAGGVEAAIAHLVELGHRKIAYIAGEEISTLSPLRITYFREAMRKQGLEIPANYIAYGDYANVAPNRKVAHDLLTLPKAQRPTAILCGGDRIAAVVIQVANILGIRIPQDLSIIGTANLTVAELLSPPLTTIGQPFREMGQAAARRLIEIVEQTAEAKSGEKVVVPAREDLQILDTNLIIRESTAVAPS